MSDSDYGLPASPSPTPRDAAAPVNASDADIILRSVDAVDFRAHKLLLSMASPFFQNLFTLPQPPTSSPHASPNELKDGISVVCLSEDEHAVDMMLRYCYPRTVCPAEPTLDTTEDVKLTLVLISKYQLAGVQGIVVQRLKAGPTLPQVLSIFLKAWLLDLRDVVPIAARHTLRADVDTSEDYEELNQVPCIVLVKLANFRKACADAASARPWTDDTTQRLSFPVADFSASCSANNNYRYSLCPAIDQYLKDAFIELKLLPSGWNLVFQNQIVTAVEKVSRSCKACHANDRISPAVIKMSRFLYEEVESRISKIEMEKSFF
ncbi:hypothetical protein FA95DRAFT_1565989 [Auriscalpium vulgare]|uniref:Uncharacterized protein n=1 Tax=Auriscalpium vulgare TaxID=40419 RepID=A0ACB8R9V9_9AGAM|nr:hypothetical protein FA95DRAFT_1565989 [Auriscalpium vulgare]